MLKISVSIAPFSFSVSVYEPDHLLVTALATNPVIQIIDFFDISDDLSHFS